MFGRVVELHRWLHCIFSFLTVFSQNCSTYCGYYLYSCCGLTIFWNHGRSYGSFQNSVDGVLAFFRFSSVWNTCWGEINPWPARINWRTRRLSIHGLCMGGVMEYSCTACVERVCAVLNVLLLDFLVWFRGFLFLYRCQDRAGVREGWRKQVCLM